jgi:hypothetical protein
MNTTNHLSSFALTPLPKTMTTDHFIGRVVDTVASPLEADSRDLSILGYTWTRTSQDMAYRIVHPEKRGQRPIARHHVETLRDQKSITHLPGCHAIRSRAYPGLTVGAY